MTTLVVPEEEWGPTSWAVTHPLFVESQIEFGLERPATATGGSRRPAIRPAGTASTASTPSAWSPTATPPMSTALTLVDAGWDDPACPRAPAVDHRLRRGRRHAARRLPRARLRSATQRSTNLANLRGRLPRSVRPRRLQGLGQRGDRSGRRPLPRPRPGNGHRRHRQRADSTTSFQDHLAARCDDALQPLMAMEEFGAGRSAVTDRTDARRQARRRVGAPDSPQRDGAPATRPPRRWRRATGLVARPGRGQVTLDWEPVDGAAGYLVRRAEGARRRVRRRSRSASRGCGRSPTRRSPTRPASRGRDGVVHRRRGRARSTTTGRQRASRSRPRPRRTATGRCRIAVDAATAVGPLDRPWRPMIGSERLSQLDARRSVPAGGRSARSSPTRCAWPTTSSACAAVRAHAILHDDLGVYREVDGVPRARLPRRRPHLRPRPGARSAPDRRAQLHAPRPRPRPDRTVFHYGAIISPPEGLGPVGPRSSATSPPTSSSATAATRCARGASRSGTRRTSTSSGRARRRSTSASTTSAARAVKSVDAQLPVGGPASAAVAWIDDLLERPRAPAPRSTSSRRTPTATRPSTCGRSSPATAAPAVRLWWTEWGAHATHFNRAHDSVWSARLPRARDGQRDGPARRARLLDRVRPLRGARPPAGAAPRRLRAARRRQPAQAAVVGAVDARAAAPDSGWRPSVDGDGAGDMVNAVADRRSPAAGSTHRRVERHRRRHASRPATRCSTATSSSSVTGLPAARYRVRHRRLDAVHSDLNAVWGRLAGGRDWPRDDEWAALRRSDRLEDLQPEWEIDTDARSLLLSFELPMPAVSLIELDPRP